MSDLPLASRKETTYQMHVRHLKGDVCVCPFCREGRGEKLTDYDKWYLKGFNNRGVK